MWYGHLNCFFCHVQRSEIGSLSDFLILYHTINVYVANWKRHRVKKQGLPANFNPAPGKSIPCKIVCTVLVLKAVSIAALQLHGFLVFLFLVVTLWFLVMFLICHSFLSSLRHKQCSWHVFDNSNGTYYLTTFHTHRQWCGVGPRWVRVYLGNCCSQWGCLKRLSVTDFILHFLCT